MTDAKSPDLRCERVRLLLSLSIDSATTPAQEAEIEAHVPDCAECRAAQAADVAVHQRAGEQAQVPAGFAAGVIALQIHSGPAMTIQFKDLKIKMLKD